MQFRARETAAIVRELMSGNRELRRNLSRIPNSGAKRDECESVERAILRRVIMRAAEILKRRPPFRIFRGPTRAVKTFAGTR